MSEGERAKQKVHRIKDPKNSSLRPCIQLVYLSELSSLKEN